MVDQNTQLLSNEMVHLSRSELEKGNDLEAILLPLFSTDRQNKTGEVIVNYSLSEQCFPARFKVQPVNVNLLRDSISWKKRIHYVTSHFNLDLVYHADSIVFWQFSPILPAAILTPSVSFVSLDHAQRTSPGWKSSRTFETLINELYLAPAPKRLTRSFKKSSGISHVTIWEGRIAIRNFADIFPHQYVSFQLVDKYRHPVHGSLGQVIRVDPIKSPDECPELLRGKLDKTDRVYLPIDLRRGLDGGNSLYVVPSKDHLVLTQKNLAMARSNPKTPRA
jgi:hypothetical protein